jgi:hypothetical protein
MRRRRPRPYKYKSRSIDVVSHVTDRPDLHDLDERLAERDARVDDRTPGEVALGDPPKWRCALKM